jgi:hypothetical protein
MRRLSELELLSVWESGIAATPSWRAWSLLAAACPEVDVEALGELSPGQRDRELLALRRLTFGDNLDCVARCPACAESLEFALDAGSLLPEHPAHVGESMLLSRDTYDIKLRLPTLRELVQLAPVELTRLRRACVVSAERHGDVVAISEIPNDTLAAIDEHLGAADPDANVELRQSCPGCGHEWLERFDIIEFFWLEIHAWAERLLHQVHALARAYGWSEPDVLRLSAVRRQHYLELLGV